MPRINKTKYALLGVLSMGPASGYDIKEKMAASTNHFWREGDSSIYPILKQLLNDKLVTCELENQDSDKPKKVYSINAAGSAALESWLLKEPEWYQGRNELLLKVFFGWNVEPTAIITHLQSFKQRLETFQALHTQRCQRLPLDSDGLHRLLTLNAGIIYSKAGIDWCEQSIEALNHAAD